jgi:nucleoid-associated protein EbfC
MKFPGGMNLQQMMKQAQKMQEEMAQEMQALRVDATAGGGIIKVVMSGSKELVSIKIEPDAAGDVEMLEDLIMAAVNECSRKVDEAMQDKLGGALGGLKIPGLT